MMMRAYSSIMTSIVADRGSTAIGDDRIAQAEHAKCRKLWIKIDAKLLSCDTLAKKRSIKSW